MAAASDAPIAAGSRARAHASAIAILRPLLVVEVDLRAHVLVEAIVANVADDADNRSATAGRRAGIANAAAERIDVREHRLGQPLVDDRHRRRVLGVARR